MKTYCWKCEKKTGINNPRESKKNDKLIRGSCEVCGIPTYRTIKGSLKLENKPQILNTSI